ncbi:NAD(P)H-dependent oxidoreductase [Alcaligenes faecalis subsp. faecalis]|uniref:NAD(P)H-dependent oxidoreductase n=1 Tax=Alcaligenes faecalis TaxID=511 RepID=UPI002351A1E4|nr:NAD(P)H-dependent oxidoreductase [Alcaligenes faecalis]MBW4787539.1 NAD(P)H-dependent oxidoreductase [Alcaligenes faecalis subsp. faecalis]
MSHPDLDNLDEHAFKIPDMAQLLPPQRATHPPRILLLYGSLRERSYSRFLTQEAARLLQSMGAETRVFNPHELPLPDGAPEEHPKVQELRQLVQWAEGMVWTSPERHGAMSSVLNQMRVLGRWMRLITIPNQSSVAKAFLEFDEEGRMKPSSYYERVVDVMEELVKFTLLTRDCAEYLVDRYSERKETAQELSARVQQRNI